MILPGDRATLTPAVLRLLGEMSREDVPLDEAEAVCDRFEVWVGEERFHRETINRALRLCAVRDVSEEAGLRRYEISEVGRCLMADPEQADELCRLLLSGRNITVRDGKIVEFETPSFGRFK